MAIDQSWNIKYIKQIPNGSAETFYFEYRIARRHANVTKVMFLTAEEKKNFKIYLLYLARNPKNQAIRKQS